MQITFIEFNFELGKFDELILEIKLTRAEKMILLHLKKGLNIKAIAADMNISPNTARVHIARIHKKLGVNNQADTDTSLTEFMEGQLNQTYRCHQIQNQ